MTTVLIAEHNDHQRLLFQEEFELEGYEVLLTGSGQEALQYVAEENIDAVVLAIALPGMDGIETLRKIRDLHRHLPVVINTAYSSYKDKFMSWSADAYVVKSSDLTELKAEIRRALEKGEE